MHPHRDASDFSEAESEVVTTPDKSGCPTIQNSNKIRFFIMNRI